MFRTLSAMGLVGVVVLAGCNYRPATSAVPPPPAPRVSSTPARPTAVMTAAMLEDGNEPFGAYDRSRPVDFYGGILSVDRRTLSDERVGIFIRLQVGGEVATIFIAPEQFLQYHRVNLRTAANISGTGAIASSGEGGTLILARDINFDGERLQLRTEAGSPMWGGGQPVSTRSVY